MSIATTRPPKPWLAALFGAICKGSGHVYAGYWKRGFILAALWLVLPSLGNLALWIVGPAPWLWHTVWLRDLPYCLIFAFSTLDAMRLARLPLLKRRLTGLFLFLLLVLAWGLWDLLEATRQFHRTDHDNGALIPTTQLMRGDEMAPALGYLDDYLLDVWAKRPKIDDIVAYRPAPTYHGVQEQMVSRVVGLPGDTIEVRDHILWRGGRPIDEPWIAQGKFNSWIRDMEPITLTPGAYLCMTDQRWFHQYTDYWELVSQDRILGVVGMIVESIEYDRIGLKPSLPERSLRKQKARP